MVTNNMALEDDLDLEDITFISEIAEEIGECVMGQPAVYAANALLTVFVDVAAQSGLHADEICEAINVALVRRYTMNVYEEKVSDGEELWLIPNTDDEYTN